MTQHHGPGRMRRAICPVCTREVAVYIPTQGDGSADVYRTHRDREGGTCEGWSMTVEPDAYVDAT